MKHALIYTADGELIRLRRPAGFRRDIEAELVPHSEVALENVPGQMIGYPYFFQLEARRR